jgi:hypothetical protein
MAFTPCRTGTYESMVIPKLGKILMNEKKPRKAIINIHIEQGDSIERVWDEKRQVLTLKVMRDEKNVSAKKIQFTTFYLRSKKPKILNQLEFNRSSAFTVSHGDSLKQYAQVWAIDTNTKEIFSQTAHVSAVTVCSTDGMEEYFPVLAIIFGKTKENPELYGWRKFIEFVQAANQYSPEHRYGLIVDSEFSKISEFNSRNSPIHGNFYLPPNWILIYATSDSGKESIINKLLAKSDKASSAVLELISGKQSNAKYWQPINNEEQHQPAFFPLVE